MGRNLPGGAPSPVLGRTFSCPSHGREATEALNEKAPAIAGAFSSAETEGFEPSVPQGELHLSRVVHSAGLCDVS